jgi:hypothetical protein
MQPVTANFPVEACVGQGGNPGYCEVVTTTCARNRVYYEQTCEANCGQGYIRVDDDGQETVEALQLHCDPHTNKWFGPMLRGELQEPVPTLFVDVTRPNTTGMMNATEIRKNTPFCRPKLCEDVTQKYGYGLRVVRAQWEKIVIFADITIKANTTYESIVQVSFC